MNTVKYKAWTDEGMISVRRITFAGDIVYVVSDNDEHDGYEFQIDISKLRQFTGLKDSKGVEIYEGDIVNYRDVLYMMTWNDGASNIGEHDDKWGDCIGWYLRKETTVKNDYDTWLELCSDTIYEVVGNIYENPELLETT